MHNAKMFANNADSPGDLIAIMVVVKDSELLFDVLS